jgi:hypothetical protein
MTDTFHRCNRCVASTPPTPEKSDKHGEALADAAAVAMHLGVESGWVYDHADCSRD